MKAKHFKKLRQQGKWFDCYYRWDILRWFTDKPTKVFALSAESAALKTMMRKHIEPSSWYKEATESSETFGKVMVFPEGSKNFRFRRIYR